MCFASLRSIVSNCYQATEALRILAISCRYQREGDKSLGRPPYLWTTPSGICVMVCQECVVLESDTDAHRTPWSMSVSFSF